jgi:hypothetical protein
MRALLRSAALTAVTVCFAPPSAAAAAASGASVEVRGLTISEALLTPEECAFLIAQAKPLLVRSETAGGESDVRSSSSAWLPWVNSTVHYAIETKVRVLDQRAELCCVATNGPS